MVHTSRNLNGRFPSTVRVEQDLVWISNAFACNLFEATARPKVQIIFKTVQNPLHENLYNVSISNNCHQMASEIMLLLLLQMLLTYVCLLVLVRMITNPQ